MPKLNLTRDVLAQIAQGNKRAIAALEQVFEDVGDTFPSTIEEANALAGSALAVAQASAAALALLADALARLDAAPATPPHVEADDTTPRAHLGTISAQNADSVEITGGTVDGTAIGATTAAAAKFTTVSASGQIASTVSTGTAPLVIASTTKVANLYVDRAASADTAANLGTAATYPANATDLPSCIALANAIKAANIAKGV
jgi:hypothetical protein